MMKRRIYAVLIAFNLSVLLKLFFENLNVRLQMTVYDLAIPGYFLGNSELPNLGNITVSSFSINWLLIIMYLLVVGATVYLLLNEKEMDKKVKIGILSGASLLLLLIIIFNLAMGIVSVILLIANLIIYFIVKAYTNSEKNYKAFIAFAVFAGLILLTDTLLNTYSADGKTALVLLDHALFSGNLLTIQSTLNYYLFSHVISEIVYINWVILAGFAIFGFGMLLEKLTKNNSQFDYNELIRYIGGVFVYLKPVILVAMVLYYSTIYTEYFKYPEKFATEGEINEGYCFTDEYKGRNIGSNILDGDNYFFSCYDTSEGTITVRHEIGTTNKQNLFDLIHEDIDITRYYVEDEEGNEILSITPTDKKVQITMTTKEEFEEGYKNIILVKYFNPNGYSTYEIYDYDGNLMVELPQGAPQKIQLRVVSLYDGGVKVLTKSDSIIYSVLENSSLEDKIYHFDGTITEITE